MKIKTSELIDEKLNWAVVKASGQNADYWLEKYASEDRRCMCESPSTDWSQGGPIIEREGINTLVHVTVNGVITKWKAGKDWPMSRFPYYTGPTPLIAAMRCFCASRLGDEVEIPEELA